MNRKNRRAGRRKAGFRGAGPYPAAIQALLDDAVKHHRAGNFADAAAGYRRVLTRHRDNADALNLLGLIHHQQGNAEQALDLVTRAAEMAPDNPFVRNNLGVVLRDLGRNNEAIGHFRHALSLDGGYVEAGINLGNALTATGQADAAIAIFRDLLQRVPGSSELHVALAIILTDKGELQDAGAHFRRAAELDPASPVAHYNLGNHYFHVGEDEAAIASFRKAVALAPQYAEAFSQLGSVLRRAGSHDEALTALRSALRLQPDNAPTWLALAATHRDLRQLDQARDAIRKAIGLDPAAAEPYNELAYIMRCLGRHDDAIAAYSKARELDPDHPFAATNRATVYLAEGRFTEGWRDYSGLTQTRRTRERLYRERLPEDLSGKSVVVASNQGLGDQIFFLRFLSQLKRRHARVIYEGEPKLVSLLERVPALDAVTAEEHGDGARHCDYRISVDDLPYVIGMAGTGDIPPPLPLAVATDRVPAAKAALHAFGPPPYIGVTWRAGGENRDRYSKEVPLESMAQLLKPVSATLVALQRNPRSGEMIRFSETVERPVCDMTSLNDDLESMLALLDELDDYVCVSNTNTHLRAGLGRTCRVLAPYPAEFRWMSRGTESPWFPGTRVYRETHEDGWTIAFDALASDLAAAYP